MGSRDWWVTTLFQDRKGTLWIGTRENRLFYRKSGTTRSFSFSHRLSSNHIQSLYEDKYGNLWIGTQGGGIDIFSFDTNRLSRYNREEAFRNITVWDFFQDREGSLWIGTGGNGLNCLRETEIKTYSTKNGLSNANVYGVFQDCKGRIWSGSKGHGINILENQQFYQLTVAEGLSCNSVVSFAEDLEGNIWFGTLGNGVNRYKNGQIDIFTTHHGLSLNSTRSVYVDPGGTVWAGTIDGGIHRFQGQGFQKVADAHSRINVMRQDSSGNMWIGTFGAGLVRLNKNKLDVFNTDHGFTSNIITSIYEDRENTLWIGSVRGLTRFKNGQIHNILKKDGLPDEKVYCILADSRGDFWISCNKGIYRLRYKEVEGFINGSISRVNPSLYGKESGMLSPECNGGNQPSGYMSEDGKMWFPTTGGISVIDPMNVGINKMPPPVVIESVVSGDVEQLPRGKEMLFFKRGQLSIHYTAPAFIVPRKIRFRYRLEGFDNQWVDAGSRRVATYDNLSPGMYRFQVTACNNDGFWNTTGAAIILKRIPRFYQTTLFKILVLLVLLGVALLIYFFVFKGLNLRKLKTRNHSGNQMDPEEVNRCVKKLLYALDVDKIYRNPDLKINVLASILLISPRNLSRIINDRLDTNFYELVNEYRIKEAQEILLSVEGKSKSILDVSLEVGYNSKSAFNRAFKNFTGVTPSQYKKKHPE
jgi:AraC-like DNA-binding protein/streptogramin lyase